MLRVAAPRLGPFRPLIASPSTTGAQTPANLPTSTRASATAMRVRSQGAPERMTSWPRSAIDRQKLNFTPAAAGAPPKRPIIPGWANAKRSGPSVDEDGGLHAPAGRHPVDSEAG